MVLMNAILVLHIHSLMPCKFTWIQRNKWLEHMGILFLFWFVEDEKPKVAVHDNVHVQIEKALTEIVTSLTDNFDRNIWQNVEPWFVYVGMKVNIVFLYTKVLRLNASLFKDFFH